MNTVCIKEISLGVRCLQRHTFVHSDVYIELRVQGEKRINRPNTFTIPGFLQYTTLFGPYKIKYTSNLPLVL